MYRKTVIGADFPTSCCPNSRKRALEFEQFALHLEASAVAAKGAVRGDDPVARHDYGYGVSMVRHADGAEASWISYGAGDGGVGTSFAVGNVPKRIPAGDPAAPLGAADLD